MICSRSRRPSTRVRGRRRARCAIGGSEHDSGGIECVIERRFGGEQRRGGARALASDRCTLSLAAAHLGSGVAGTYRLRSRRWVVGTDWSPRTASGGSPMIPRARYPFIRQRRLRQPGWKTFQCRLCGSEDYAGWDSPALADGRCVECSISDVTGFATRECPEHGTFEVWASARKPFPSSHDSLARIARNTDGTIGTCPQCEDDESKKSKPSFLAWLRGDRS